MIEINKAKQNSKCLLLKVKINKPFSLRILKDFLKTFVKLFSYSFIDLLLKNFFLFETASF